MDRDSRSLGYYFFCVNNKGLYVNNLINFLKIYCIIFIDNS